eukprot:1518192-Amphidinium_carterae.1
MLAQQLANWSLKQGIPPEVTSIMTSMLEDLEDDIDHQQDGRLAKKKAKGVMVKELSSDLTPQASKRNEPHGKLFPPRSATSSWVTWVAGSTTHFNAEIANIEANQSIIEKLQR